MTKYVHRTSLRKAGKIIAKKLFTILLLLIFLGTAFFLLHPGTRDIRHNIIPVLRETLPPVLGKVYWNISQRVLGQYPDDTDLGYVLEYVDLNTEYRRLSALLRREKARGNPGLEIEQELEKVEKEREAVRPFAEAVVEQQVAAVIREEGLLLAGGRVLPPAKFTFANSYYILVTSPRKEIRLEYSRLLGRDLTLLEQESIEREKEEQSPDLSVLVLPVGGLAVFYPAQIYHRGDLIRLLDLSVHEWLHQYLYVASPLGRTYLQGGRMRTINETITNMLGREIGEQVYLRFYAVPGEAEAIEASFLEYLQELSERTPEKSPEEVEGFSFALFMRETYLEAARLLEEGETAAAEGYMEKRRRMLLEEGYSLRRINQAYFAFYGSYADSPITVDRIGPALARWRLETSSPAEFLAPLRKVASYEDFLSVMEEKGIPIP